MIGIIANPDDHAIVREFFELFKTPWEFWQPNRTYDVLLCDGSGEIGNRSEKLIVLYSDREVPEDKVVGGAVQASIHHFLSYKGNRIPIQGKSLTFPDIKHSFLHDAELDQAASYIEKDDDSVLLRIGYDLFTEVRILLEDGQPISDASTPSLELHIEILRDLIVATGSSLVEIPPVPYGCKFVACLTHDVDHPAIRFHRLDHTILGFLYRALFGSFFSLIKGHKSLKGLWRSWAAAWKLPFIYLGWAQDFWLQFDRYPVLENGHPSSFFLIPFKDNAGQLGKSAAPKKRAVRYCPADIKNQVQKLLHAGCEIGLHGIDAWHDTALGCAEMEQIHRTTGTRVHGVRIHWLYFDNKSPLTLERAGAEYDSTIGYNETIGYRAGTTQVYKPLGASSLLELPLHIMDTAMFYPSYLNLSPAEAKKRVSAMIATALRFGGCVTVNWHDRSIAAERLWDASYIHIIGELEKEGACFATASDVVSWFRKRRSATFDMSESGVVRVRATDDNCSKLPDLQLRVHDGWRSENLVIGAEGLTHTLEPALGWVPKATFGDVAGSDGSQIKYGQLPKT
jgi:hypothetical protein